ncbi:MAG: hypothetical protein AAF596_06750, partial [Planctomycetota bacterium]
DIVLGRIFGFGLVGTVMLLIMALAGYAFVNRTLEHTHAVEVDSLENISTASGEVIGSEGRTARASFHRHEVQLGADGNGVATATYGHSHTVRSPEPGRYALSGAEDALRARVPKLGSISFRGRNGQKEQRGVSTGSEWTYRSSIEGGTQAAAVWRFDDVTEADLRTVDGEKVLPISLIVRVFRTHKGNLERAIQGTIQLQNPDNPEVRSDVRVFPARDYQIDQFDFPMEQYDTDQNPINLMDDLVSEDGAIEIVVQALDRAQYFNFAQADCYIRRPDGSPAWNYAKCCASIWSQMLIVITIGVTASTFLNGPIATMLTASAILLGFFRDYFVAVALGEEWGGGPIESAVRMYTHMNVMSPFEESPAVTLMQSVDTVLQTMMRGVALLLPNFPSLSTTDYVARGFAVPGPLVGRSLTIALAYVVGLTIAAFFILRSREVAKD